MSNLLGNILHVKEAHSVNFVGGLSGSFTKFTSDGWQLFINTEPKRLEIRRVDDRIWRIDVESGLEDELHIDAIQEPDLREIVKLATGNDPGELIPL